MKTIYIDTSVFGGVFDPEFELWSDLFFRHCINFNLTLIISNVAEDELTKAPERVK